MMFQYREDKIREDVIIKSIIKKINKLFKNKYN